MPTSSSFNMLFLATSSLQVTLRNICADILASLMRVGWRHRNKLNVDDRGCGEWNEEIIKINQKIDPRFSSYWGKPERAPQ